MSISRMAEPVHWPPEPFPVFAGRLSGWPGRESRHNSSQHPVGREQFRPVSADPEMLAQGQERQRNACRSACKRTQEDPLPRPAEPWLDRRRHGSPVQSHTSPRRLPRESRVASPKHSLLRGSSSLRRPPVQPESPRRLPCDRVLARSVAQSQDASRHRGRRRLASPPVSDRPSRRRTDGPRG